MSDKIRIRAFLKKDIATIKVIISHPMETGLRKDKESGKTIPAHYITEVNALLNDEKVLTCQWGSGVSKNPYLSFDLKDSKAGDKVRVVWSDNQGQSGEGEMQLS